MPIPVSIHNVATRDRGVGELILTRGVIYFFPYPDLSTTSGRRKAGATVRDAGLHLLHLTGVAALGWVGVGLVAMQKMVGRQVHARRNRDRLKVAGLWRDGDSSSMLQQRLDEHLNQLAAQRRSPNAFPEVQPRPERYALRDLRSIRVTRTGTLRLEHHYEKLRFRVGLRRRRALRDALWEAGFRLGPTGDKGPMLGP